MLVQLELTHCLETPEVQLFTDLAFFKIICNNKSNFIFLFCMRCFTLT